MAVVVTAGSEGAPRRRKREPFGVEELGQTNAAVVGRNFVAALLKAESQRGTGMQHLGDGLAAVGYPVRGARLQALAFEGIRQAPAPEARIALWKEAMRGYTMEGCDEADDADKSLYRDFTDSEDLPAWASYLACIFFGGQFGGLTSCLAPPSALPRRRQTTYRGFSMPAELAGRYPKGARFFWQTLVSTSKSRETSETFAFAAASLKDCPGTHAPPSSS
jgi:hypothetical protein